MTQSKILLSASMITSVLDRPSAAAESSKRPEDDDI